MNWLTDSIREFIHRGDRLLLTLCLLASEIGRASCRERVYVLV